MLRLFNHDDHEDWDANGAAVQPGGALLLTRQTVEQHWNPQSGRMETQVSNPQLVVIVAAGGWTRLVNPELDEAEPGADPV